MTYWIVRIPPFVRGDYFNLVIITQDYDVATASIYKFKAKYPTHTFAVWVADDEGNVIG